MSHEVRTPLSAILGFTGILADTPLDARQRRHVETIQKAGSSLLELLNDILDYTKFESGKVDLEKIAWTPALMVHEVMQLLQPRAEEKKVMLNFENQLPAGLTLCGDPTRVRQILLNLVSNAVKFTERGSVTVWAEWYPAAGTNGRGELSIDVIDTGIGIPPEKVPHLFEAFSQADASTTRQHGGTGLGLAICKRLSDLMGARLTLQSLPGSGTTLSFRLEAGTVAAQARPGSGSVSAAPVALWSRALVVDDAKLNRELLKVMLRRFGLEADVAGSGPEAAVLAAKNQYAIIFTDLEMPDMDGFATARKIRAQEPAGVHCPIVAVSALTTPGTREKCIAAGMEDYLSKPVYLPALGLMIDAMAPPARRHLAPPPARRAAPAPQPVMAT
jgi:hypothetical protein